jgi:hypothetical protein
MQQHPLAIPGVLLARLYILLPTTNFPLHDRRFLHTFQGLFGSDPWPIVVPLRDGCKDESWNLRVPARTITAKVDKGVVSAYDSSELQTPSVTL